MKIMHRGLFIVAAVALTIAFTGCGATDVVAKFANASFASVVATSGDRVAWSDEDYSWALSSPEGDRVLFSSDFSRNGAMDGNPDMDKPDAEFIFDAAPFIDAGLDIANIPSADGVKYEIEDGTLMLHFELGSDTFADEAKKSLVATFAEIVRTERARIGYHEKLDHYGIMLGDGNMLEWAKDMAKNDKDLVFVLNPAPFIAAGVDPAKIRGWVFAKVETKDDAGKAVFVDKLLKPFDLQ